MASSIPRTADSISGPVASANINPNLGTVSIRWTPDLAQQAASATLFSGDLNAGISIGYTAAGNGIRTISRSGINEDATLIMPLPGSNVSESSVSFGDSNVPTGSMDGLRSSSANATPSKIVWGANFHLGSNSAIFNGWIMGFAVYQNSFLKVSKIN